MFDGYMPPRATAAGPAGSVSGRSSIPANAVVGATPLASQTYGIVEGTWPDAEPRCVVVGGYAGQLQVTNFPPAAVLGSSHRSGLITVGGALWVSGFTQPMALRLEYGHGSATKSVWLDYEPGAYNLPACSWVRVSVVPWHVAGWVGNGIIELAASIGSGNMQDCIVPTATGIVTGAGPWVASPPAQARAFIVTSDGQSGADIITASGAGYCLRNYATGAFVPGYDPVELGGPGDLTITHTVPAAYVVLKWLFQL